MEKFANQYPDHKQQECTAHLPHEMWNGIQQLGAPVVLLKKIQAVFDF